MTHEGGPGRALEGAASSKDEQSMTLPELAARYELDIVYSCRALGARMAASRAKRYLQSAGRRALLPIADHLAATRGRKNLGGYDSSEELRVAWVTLLAEIAIDGDFEEAPPPHAELSEWEEWARVHAL